MKTGGVSMTDTGVSMKARGVHHGSGVARVRPVGTRRERAPPRPHLVQGLGLRG